MSKSKVLKALKQHKSPSPRSIIMEFYIKPLLPVTKESAKTLSKMFNTSQQFWLNLQRNYEAKQ